MAQLRKDPILGDWVIVSPDRAARPFDHDATSSKPPAEPCPFCRGHESATPDAVLTVSEGRATDEWNVRIIPNRFPAVVSDQSMTGQSAAGYFQKAVADGFHEVIVESPSHHRSMRELSQQQVFRVVRAWRDRLKAISAEKSVAHTMIFKNEGAGAGASLEHVHSQLLATSFVPARIDAELRAGQHHFRQTGRVLWSEVRDQELEAAARLVTVTRQFVVLCPFASRCPGEMCVFPVVASPSFETTTDACLKNFASVLIDCLERLHRVFPQAPFNLVLHTAPPRDDRRAAYLWHLTITPRLTGIAGFELGSGTWINIMTPEDAAARYQDSRS